METIYKLQKDVTLYINNHYAGLVMRAVEFVTVYDENGNIDVAKLVNEDGFALWGICCYGYTMKYDGVFHTLYVNAY